MDATTRLIRIDADGLADANRVLAGPTSILIEVANAEDAKDSPIRGSILIRALGRTADVELHPASPRADRLDRRGCILIPGLVNAHTHLDLTHIGPRLIPGGFLPFIDIVRSHRHVEDAEIAASVADGIRLSLAGGVVAVGDIAGAPAGRANATPWRTLHASPMWGVTFFEFFAIGNREAASIERYREFVAGVSAEAARASGQRPARTVVGLQPHAPYTVSPAAYRAAIELARRAAVAGEEMPLSTHLSETPEEIEFIAHARGGQRDLLERLGVWDDSILRDVGQGRSPLQHLEPVLRERAFLCAHVNCASDRDIEILARANASVAYCPRASEYFEAQRHFGPHRYRDMLAASVNVCLGTDSIINLPPDESGGVARISTLDEMRRLYARDACDPQPLLAMATINGARALGLSEPRFVLREDTHPLGIVAVPISAPKGDPLAAMLSATSAPELLTIASH